MALLDLDELPTVFDQSRLWSHERANLISYRRKDYHGNPTMPLAQSVRETVHQQLGWAPTGRIELLTHLRFFGYCFNPVSFYYLYSDNAVRVVVAEITNTPWAERFSYVLPVTTATRTQHGLHWSFPKQFHVSPFIDMERDYQWQLTSPADRIRVHMAVDRNDGDREFEAALSLRREPICAAAVRRATLRFPAMTMQVLLNIHIQAAKLWLKKVPWFVHPRKRSQC